MALSTLSQPQASSYCFKSKKVRKRLHPYTHSPLPQLQETGTDESSIACLVSELAGLMLAPSNSARAVKHPQCQQSHNSKHHPQLNMLKTLFQQHQLSPIHQNVPTVPTWQGYCMAPWGPYFFNVGPGPGPGYYPFWYPYHVAWPWLPSHSVGISSSYGMFGSGVGGLLVQQSRAEPATVHKTHEQMQKAIAMQHTVPSDAQNPTATSASQGYVPGASSQNGQVPQDSVPSSLGPASASEPLMPIQHLGPSSSNGMGGSENGVLNLRCTASTAITDQNGQMQVAIQLTTGQDPSNLMEKNSAALSAWQGGLQLPCSVSTAVTDGYGLMAVVIKLTIPSDTESASIPVNQNVLSNKTTQCPLDPSSFSSKRWTLEEVEEIENHVQTASSCPHGPHPSLQDLVITGLQEFQRSTPLLMACSHGDLEAVKRIVERWGINVCKANVHPIMGIAVEEVTPLFLAASKWYRDIVRYLLQKGANVSAKTNSEDHENGRRYSGLTPLHAAMRLGGNHGNQDSSMQISTVRCLLEANPSAFPRIGVPIWLKGDTEGEVVALLTRSGLSLGHRSDGGVTLLHRWASGFDTQHTNTSLHVAKMLNLLRKGGDLQARDLNDCTVILTAAKGNNQIPNLPVLDILLERDDILRIDKIDALELAGAVILGNDENHEIFPIAFQYWRRALTLRLMDTDGCRPIYKTPAKTKSTKIIEWSTLDDILEIEQQPSLREIQSLLVRLRIFDPYLRLNGFLNDYLPYFFDFLTEGVNPNRSLVQIMGVACLTIEKIDVELPLLFAPRTEAKRLLSNMSYIIGDIIKIIQNLPVGDSNFNAANLKTLVELIVVMMDLHFYNLKSGEFREHAVNHGINLYKMFKIFSRHPEFVTEDMKLCFKQLVCCDYRSDPCDPKSWISYSVLHAACDDLTDETVSIVSFLLQLKADPNVIGHYGNSPLHLLARTLEVGTAEIRDATARLLLVSGAHLDMVDREGSTPADAWLEQNGHHGFNVVWEDLPNWLKGDCPQLKCLCARVIRRHQVPFEDETALPAVLIPFITMH